jgi:hypothetical protein
MPIYNFQLVLELINIFAIIAAPSRVGLATIRPRVIGSILEIKYTINGLIKSPIDLLVAAAALSIPKSLAIRHKTFPIINGFIR